MYEQLQIQNKSFIEYTKREKVKMISLIVIGILASITAILYLPLSIYIFAMSDGFKGSFFLLFFSLVTVFMGVFLIPVVIWFVLTIRKIVLFKIKRFKPLKNNTWSASERVQMLCSKIVLTVTVVVALLFFILSLIVFFVVIFHPDYEYDMMMIAFVPGMLGWLAIVVGFFLWINTHHNAFYISVIIAIIVPWLHKGMLAWTYENFFTSYGFPVVIYECLLILVSILQLYHCIKNNNVSRETF